MSRIRPILHASDFSPASRAAFKRALQLARTNRAELVIVHVYSRTVPYVREPALREQMRATIRARAQKQLLALVDEAQKTRVRAKGLLLEGIPHDRIVRAAKGRRADVIVIGTRAAGRGSPDCCWAASPLGSSPSPAARS